MLSCYAIQYYYLMPSVGTTYNHLPLFRKHLDPPNAVRQKDPELSPEERQSSPNPQRRRAHLHPNNHYKVSFSYELQGLFRNNDIYSLK